MAKAAEAPELDKAEIKKLLIRSKKEPVNCGLGLGPKDMVLIMLDKIKQPRAVFKELEKKFPDLKTPRWGTASVDVDEDPKLVKFSINKAAPGFARKLKKTLKGTGFTKVMIMSDDGSPPEHVDEEEEEEGQGSETQAASNDDTDANEDGGDQATPEAPVQPEPVATAPDGGEAGESEADQTESHDQEAQVDPAALTKRLTDLVKRMVPVLGSNPSLGAQLKELATHAQGSLKGGDFESAETAIDQLEAMLDDGGDATAGAATTPAAAPPAPPMDPAKQAALAAAPKIWTDTMSSVASGISALKAAIRKEFASEAPEVVADIEKNLGKIDNVTKRFDKTLGDILDKANKAVDEAARKSELTTARKMLADHIKYAASEPLIGMIDQNPFGVSPDLKKTLVTNLTQLANAVR